MAALTADRKITTTGARQTFTADVAAATRIFGGALVAKNADGYAVPADDDATLMVIGVALEQADNRTGGDGAKTVQLATGVHEFGNAGGAIVQAGKHALCYIADDNNVTDAATAADDVVAGLVVGFTATKVLVDVDPLYAATVAPLDERVDVLELGSLGVQNLAGAGAIDLTKGLTKFTSTGAAQALTIADGTVVGQEHTIVHVADGGSGVLTAGGALHLTAGIASISLVNAWDWCRLRWTGALWDYVGGVCTIA